MRILALIGALAASAGALAQTVETTAQAAAPAAAPAKAVAGLPGVGQVVISLALVVGLVLVLAFFYRKLQLKLPGSQHFKIVSSLAVGQRERILVIEIQGKQRVIGVTPHSVNFLFELETPLPTEKLASDFHTQLQSFLKK